MCSWLVDELHKVNSHNDRPNNLNCLFSDGEYLFVYHDKRGYKSLHVLNRVPPFSEVHYNDIDISIDLGDFKDPTHQGVVVATIPLTSGEEWVSLQPGELWVYRLGELFFTNKNDDLVPSSFFAMVYDSSAWLDGQGL